MLPRLQMSNRRRHSLGRNSTITSVHTMANNRSMNNGLNQQHRQPENQSQNYHSQYELYKASKRPRLSPTRSSHGASFNSGTQGRNSKTVPNPQLQMDVSKATPSWQGAQSTGTGNAVVSPPLRSQPESRGKPARVVVREGGLEGEVPSNVTYVIRVKVVGEGRREMRIPGPGFLEIWAFSGSDSLTDVRKGPPNISAGTQVRYMSGVMEAKCHWYITGVCLALTDESMEVKTGDSPGVMSITRIQRCNVDTSKERDGTEEGDTEDDED